jgi:hypothetical protein
MTKPTIWSQGDRLEVVGGTAFEHGSEGTVLFFHAKMLTVEVGGVKKRLLKTSCKSLEVIHKETTYTQPVKRAGYIADPNHPITAMPDDYKKDEENRPPTTKRSKKRTSPMPEHGMSWKRAQPLPSPRRA